MPAHTEKGVLAALKPGPEVVHVVEERVARETGLAAEDVRVTLSRLLTEGRIRLVRRDGVLCVEVVRGETR